MPRELMRLRSVVTVFCITVLSRFEANAQVNVRQEHNNASRDGVYVDAAFTLSAATNLTRDLNFDGTTPAMFTLSRFTSKADRMGR